MMDKIKVVYRSNKMICFSYVLAILMYVLARIIIPGFGVGTHNISLIKEIAILGILSIGQTFVIITGGTDMSIPWNMNSAAVLLTYFCHESNSRLLYVLPLVILFCTLMGLINGLGVAYLHIPPIIMTLGINSVLQGMLLGMLKGAAGGNAPSLVEDLVAGSLFGIPNLIILWIILAAIIILLMHYTTYGRKLYAVGNNQRVSYFTGIKVKPTIVKAYVMSGLTTGIAGVLLAGRLGTSYLGMGDPYLFMTLIVVVLGGTSMMGGSGSYIGTIAGSMILVILKSFLAAAKLSTSAQQILYGIILLIAVVIIPDKNRKKR